MGAFVLVQAALSAVILAFHLAVAAGCLINICRSRGDRRVPVNGGAAAVLEVIVALRNEEATLPALLGSLGGQSEETCRFLFVNDRSTDSTGRLLEAFCSGRPGRARVIHLSDEPSGLTGKQAALDRAFAEAVGDILLFTDGDCVPSPEWARSMAMPFADPRIGIVLGRVELPPGRDFLSDFQAFEQPLLNQYNFGSAGIGVPTGCFGNNMAVRSAAVKATGGFRKLGYSVTEDALLLDAVCRGGGWKARVCTGGASAITTRPKRTWGEYVEQHTRWNAGALFSPDLVTRAFYIFIVLIYLVGSLVVIPLGALDWRIPALSLNAFLSIGILAALGGIYERKRKGPYYLKLLPYLLFFGFFYGWLTVRALVRRRIEWKGSALRS